MIKTKNLVVIFILISLLSFSLYHVQGAFAEDEVIRDIFFPTEKSVTFSDTFGDPRYQHSHEATDLMGEKMMPLYAAVDGRVSYMVIPEKSWGYAITLRDAANYTYHYLHMNNDTPGTDDGQGGARYAYATGMYVGARVVEGQIIGWMGDSGNAENVTPHLHFEIRQPDKTAINPFPSLVRALDGIANNNEAEYNVGAVSASVESINIDKGIEPSSQPAACESDSVIKLADLDTLYYCGADGKRYVFPNEKIYFSWYDDFSEVEIISAEDMATLTLGGNVTYRPGSRLVKIQTDPKVYAVEKGGVLRWVQSEETATALYGSDWNEQIDDIPDSFFMDYVVGEPI